MIARLAAGLGFLALILSSGTALSSTLEGPLQIIVSKDLQSLKVYDGDVVVAKSKVSTGKAGHSTPTGIFSIIEKKRMHHSNLYDDAPMPFMQRLTWSGIALHASSHVPSYPASHGCVRMPNDFAKMLYGLTRRGGHVLVSEGEVEPRRISHPFLFRPAVVPPDTQLLSDVQLRPAIPDATEDAVEVAMADPKPASAEQIVKAVPQDPIRVLITRRDVRQTLKDVQVLLNDLGHEAGIPDGLAGARTFAAIRSFQTAEGLKADGMLTPELIGAVYAKAGKGTPPNGQMLVRRKFKPLFDVPVTIRDPQTALGAQFLIARDVDAETGTAEWYGVSLEDRLPAAMKKRLGITADADASAPDGIVQALDRIDIPDDARGRIASLLTDGASLSISDTGLGPETGEGTDFITVTHKGPAKEKPVKTVQKMKKKPKKKNPSVVAID
ncbi:MAG: L,D-transpeptidase family protein [Shinella sp.]|nr:L,D-transpeptidase family protein [Shinella sp.]